MENNKESKCKSCYNCTDEEDDKGFFVEWCTKGHWNGNEPMSEEEYTKTKSLPDPWVNCPDYIPVQSLKDTVSVSLSKIEKELM